MTRRAAPCGCRCRSGCSAPVGGRIERGFPSPLGRREHAPTSPLDSVRAFLYHRHLPHPLGLLARPSTPPGPGVVSRAVGRGSLVELLWRKGVGGLPVPEALGAVRVRRARTDRSRSVSTESGAGGEPADVPWEARVSRRPLGNRESQLKCSESFDVLSCLRISSSSPPMPGGGRTMSSLVHALVGPARAGAAPLASFREDGCVR